MTNQIRPNEVKLQTQPIACFFCEEHPHTYPSAWLCEKPWCFPTFFPQVFPGLVDHLLRRQLEFLLCQMLLQRHQIRQDLLHLLGAGRCHFTSEAFSKKTLKLFEFNLFTLWLCQNSYWKWPFISWVFPLKMVIFNSYVSLPEGNLFNYHVNRLNMVKPAPANAPTGLRSSLLGSHIGLVSHLRILMEEAGHQTRRKPMSNWQWSLEKTQAGWDWADMISRISMYKYHYDWHY